jgi:hypothetical protein
MATLLQQLLPGLAAPPQLYDPAFSELDSALLRHLGMAVLERDEGGQRAVDTPTLFYLPHCEVRRQARRMLRGRGSRMPCCGDAGPPATPAIHRIVHTSAPLHAGGTWTCQARAPLGSTRSTPRRRLQSWLCDALLASNWEPGRLASLTILGNSFATYQERWATPGAATGARPAHMLALVDAGAHLPAGAACMKACLVGGHAAAPCWPGQLCVPAGWAWRTRRPRQQHVRQGMQPPVSQVRLWRCPRATMTSPCPRRSTTWRCMPSSRLHANRCARPSRLSRNGRVCHSCNNRLWASILAVKSLRGLAFFRSRWRWLV